MDPGATVLILPGWLNSGDAHWQSRWETLHGFRRVQQSDWEWPRRGDWMARLEEELLATEGPMVLAAHSLGCHLAVAWAAHSRQVPRVRGALLVAPPDTERDDMPPQVSTWRPIVRQRLPFPATLAYSEDDPYCDAERACGMADDWGAEVVSVGAAGHINGESGLGVWPAGLRLLRAL